MFLGVVSNIIRNNLSKQRSNQIWKTKPSQLELSQFPQVEGMNAMFWRFDCDGGDECEWSLAGSAAYVRDVKPESDVHSNLP